jgi:hypothetical protein
MRRPLSKSALLLALASTPALCAPAPGAFFGKQDCTFAVDEEKPVAGATWKGACKDGFADGEGQLEWRDQREEKAHYEGGMLRGHRHGAAYISYENGDQFEGHYLNGKRDGHGVLVEAAGTEYDGQWKDGQENGQGARTYATGGRYAGQWQDGKFHGLGKASYIGGQTYEGQFIEGKRAGSQIVAPEPDQSEYSLYKKTDPRSRELSKQELSWVKGLPFGESYDRLTPGQKQSARSSYLMLHETDEPPYPADGMQSAANWMSKVQEKGLMLGALVLYVTVGVDGKASSVKVVRSPDPELSRVASMIMMNEKFKPGICAGTPCAMVYPIRYQFTLAN